MDIYCVYLTTYLGNKMPPFYIGYVRKSRLEDGYHGTVSSKRWKELWNSELRVHPELFRTHIIANYSSSKDARDKERKLQKLLLVLKKPEMYVNRSIWPEMTTTKGKRKTPEHKRKIAQSHIGLKPTEETRKKLSLRAKERFNRPGAKEYLRNSSGIKSMQLKHKCPHCDYMNNKGNIAIHIKKHHCIIPVPSLI